MKHLPTLDRPYSSPGSWNALTSPSNSDRCVCIPEPNDALDGLGHERRVHAEVGGDLLHDEAERHHVVGHGERVGVAEVDLVLARAELVEAVLDRDAHRLERDDRLAPQLAHHVELGEVEEAGVVERLGRLGRLEDEELHLRRGVEA